MSAIKNTIFTKKEMAKFRKAIGDKPRITRVEDTNFYRDMISLKNLQAYAKASPGVYRMPKERDLTKSELLDEKFKSIKI